MKKFHTLLLGFLLGLFLMPGVSYACEIKTGKTCCKKEVKARPEQNGCCKKDKEPKEGQKDCEGKCGHSNCTTSSMQSSLFVLNEIEINRDLFDFATEKPAFYHNETTISSGFRSVWLPPKIA